MGRKAGSRPQTWSVGAPFVVPQREARAWAEPCGRAATRVEARGPAQGPRRPAQAPRSPADVAWLQPGRAGEGGRGQRREQDVPAGGSSPRVLSGRHGKARGTSSHP